MRLVKKIVQGALLIEGTGAVLLATRFIPRFGWRNGVYFSIFHAVSSFCNAGFDLMGIHEAYSSLVEYGEKTENHEKGEIHTLGREIW